jgi:hypothetical protein
MGVGADNPIQPPLKHGKGVLSGAWFECCQPLVKKFYFGTKELSKRWTTNANVKVAKFGFLKKAPAVVELQYSFGHTPIRRFHVNCKRTSPQVIPVPIQSRTAPLMFAVSSESEFFEKIERIADNDRGIRFLVFF